MVLRIALQQLRIKVAGSRTLRQELRYAEQDWRNTSHRKRVMSDAEWARVQRELEEDERQARGY